MATVKVGESAQNRDHYVTVKLGTDTVANSGDLNDNDIGKPLKWLAADRMGLCADGDAIDGFLVAVGDGTVSGYAYGTVQIGGTKRVELDGAVTILGFVEAGTIAARTVAEANGLGVVSALADPTIDDSSAATVAVSLADVLAYAKKPKWKLVSGTGLDEDTTATIVRVA